MPNLATSPEEIARRGQDYYDRFLRAKLEPKHRGKFLVLDIETGEYEIDRDEMAAIQRARARMPDRVFYILRVGYGAAHRIGARFSRKQP